MGKSVQECISNLERELAQLKAHAGVVNPDEEVSAAPSEDEESSIGEKEVGRGRRRGRQPFFKKKGGEMSSEEGEY